MKTGKRKPEAKSSTFISRKDYSWREIDFSALRREWVEKEKEKRKTK